MSDIYSLSSRYYSSSMRKIPEIILPRDEHNITNKVIWLYWNDGDLKNAPFVVRKAIDSWTYHNAANWTVIRLNKYNLHQFMDTSLIDSKKQMSIQARSDMIRLTLLARYGGVWADATMLCMEPLDHWIWDNLPKNGFWMYSRSCSWFMIAALDSYIAQRWYAAAVDYWSHRDRVSGEVGGISNYRWMDGILKDLIAKDERLRSELERMPYVECGGVCGPHGFYAEGCKYEVNQPLKKEFKECLDNNTPHAMKMTYKGRCETEGIQFSKSHNKTNGHYALYTAFKRDRPTRWLLRTLWSDWT